MYKLLQYSQQISFGLFLKDEEEKDVDGNESSVPLPKYLDRDQGDNDKWLLTREHILVAKHDSEFK